MRKENKKWYQTGEFEDGYQFGDIFRTVKNNISGKEDVEKVKSVTQKNETTGATAFGAVENGKLTFNPSAQLYGFANEKERQDYIRDNPELYTAMGGYKYVPTGIPIRNTDSITKSNEAIQGIVKRFKNTDGNKVQEALNAVGSGQWLDKNTIKKHKSTINSYVNDYISLDKLGYFDSLPEEERKFNVELLRGIKKDVKKKNTLYRTFDSIYDYNAYIMNNTAERVGGMSLESIAMRAKAYEENGARLDVIDNEIAHMTDEEKWVKVLNPYNGSQMANATINKPTEAYQKFLDEKAYLEEQNRIYERYNKQNDNLVFRYLNSEDFVANSVYIPRESKNNESGFYPDDYRTFLEYYNVGTDALVHSERVQNGEEIDDYWYTGQSRGWDYATSDEFKMLNYLANTQGDEAAQSYYEALSKDLTRRRSIAQEQKWDENYKNAEWYEKMGLNILSVPEKLYGTAFNIIEDVGNLVSGQKYDPYAAYRDIANHGDNTRKNTAIEIDEATGGSEFLGVSWGDAYQAAMSGIDSIAGVATFGGKIYPVIAGIGASSAKAKQLYEQGASESQIAAASIFAGVAEMAFEKISIGHFLDEFVNAPAKKWYQLLLKSVAQGGIEMTEEIATELSNIITDTMVLGSRSDWGKLISSYKQQGYSDGDAIISAMWDMGGNILEAGICGLISGGTMGSGGLIINTENAKKTSGYLDNVYIDNGYNSAVTNSKILNLIKKVKSGIFNANDKEYLKTPSEEIIKRITEITGIDVSGFKVAIEARQIEHILKDHGENGKTDQSMSNDSNIAKMEYVLNSPDSIVNSGTTKAYVTSVNGKNKPAQTILYEKNLNDNSYYVVQAVPDTKSKTLYIVSAFIGKKGYKKETSQTTNAISPSATPNSENAKVSNDAILDGEGDGLKDRKSHGVSSDASNYNISKRQGNVNNMKKEANLQGEGASFFDDYSGKSTSNINPDEVISGMWEDSPNKSKKIVEKSQSESVENYDESGIIKETVDNDTGIPGKYTTTIVWSIFKKLPARPSGLGYFTKKIKQHNPRVEAYENKINPNKEGYHIKHPDGRYVQFENMVNNVLQDGKCVLNKKRSFYHVYDYGYIAQKRVLEQANRQIEVANAAGYKVEWLVSDEKAVEQISRLFKENNINIIVKFYPE